MREFLILIAVFFVNYGYSQIQRIEYFIDDDPGYGLATAVAFPIGAMDVDINTTIPLTDISPGMHNLYIRSQNVNSEWSFTQKKTIYVFDTPTGGNNNLSRLEYFIDDDPGYGAGTSLSLVSTQDSQADYNIDLSAIEPGIHNLYVRAQNNYGQWSFVQKKTFYAFDASTQGNADLSRLEWFIDNDPGYGQGISLALADVQDSQADYNIDLSTVDPGMHNLYVRAQNNYGQWSFVHKKVFYVFDSPGGEREIVEIEYFLDEDPGVGSATSLNDISIPGQDLDIDFTVNAPNDSGNHIIYARAKDNFGMWSFLASDTLVWSGNEIDVIYPNGGENFTAGTGVIPYVEWDTTNNVNNVDISLVRANGEFVEMIATNQDPEGPYNPNWLIPNYINSGSYRILVEDRNNPTIKDYSEELFTINNPGNYCEGFTDLFNAGIVLNAASCLCEKAYINPQNHGYENTNGVQPTEDILRADLAKLIYFAINQGDALSPADHFPVPFVDLQNIGDPYFKYAKALSYLEYGDNIAPFDRDFINFRPYDPIELKFAAKVIVEAYNFPIDLSTNGTILNVPITEDGYAYLRTLKTMGYLSNVIITDANDFADRQDIFIILKNILDDCSSTCDESCHVPMPTNADYFTPGLFTPYNLSRSVSQAEGHFNNYGATSFMIPGINLPLQFSHSYSSHLTLLPKPYRKIEPLGEGWTHSYNSYIIKENGWTKEGASIDDNWVVFWPSGSIHLYDCAFMEPQSIGVYDDMNMPDENTIIIKKLNQISFTYTKFTLVSGEDIFMLDEIRDRNDNRIDIVNELAIVPRIDKVIGTAGRILEFNYTGPGYNEIESIQDITGNRTVYFDVDDDDNLINYTDPNGNTTSYGYTNPSDPSSNKLDHLLHSVTRPEGNTITNQYNNGFLVSHQIGSAIPTTNSIQPQYDNPLTVYKTGMTDGNGVMIDTEYDDIGNIKKKAIDDNEINYVHNDELNPTLITSMEYEGLTTNYSYDQKGRIETINLPLGISHSFSYTSLSDIKSYTDPKGNTTNYYYQNGNLQRIEDNMSFSTNFELDDKGQVIRITNPESITQDLSYDVHGNLEMLETPLDIKTIMSYDNIGRLDSIINPQQQVTKYEFDAIGLVKKVIRRSVIDGDIMTHYYYDKNNNLKTITNALGGQTILTYDNRDLLETMTFGDDTKTYTYRDDGLLDTYTKPGGHTFQYEYDNLGRLETEGYATYRYDDRDNPIKLTKDGRDIELSYDIINRLDTVDYDGFRIIYEYDLNSNLTKIKYPNNFEVSYSYDANNRLTALSFEGQTINYTYLQDGRINSTTLPNGVVKVFDYDLAGRLIHMADISSLNDTICAYQFTLDSLGNHVKEDRIEPLGDPILNALDILYSYNGENEIQTAGTVNFSFDNDGNRIMKNAQASSFDDKDMLTAFNGKDYEYDAMGLRRSVTENGVTKQYIWDVGGMGNVLSETDGSGNILYYYVHGLGLEARVNATDLSVQYYHSDYRGSTIAMTDQNETITHKYSYLPFGALVGHEEADDQPFKYVGRYGIMDEGDSLYYMRARYMDALTGRFVSEDPVWHENLFVYGENNPIRYKDENGNYSIDSEIAFAEIESDILVTQNFNTNTRKKIKRGPGRAGQNVYNPINWVLAPTRISPLLEAKTWIDLGDSVDDIEFNSHDGDDEREVIDYPRPIEPDISGLIESIQKTKLKSNDIIEEKSTIAEVLRLRNSNRKKAIIEVLKIRNSKY